MTELKLIVISTITGFGVGALFSLFRLPIPAPPTFAGVSGIIGVYLGYKGFIWIAARFF
ncbi:XapX domain-containing protein [Candidatus Marinamargulisbacteria bacterium SCGC AG-439-L15]|nr:XapX domain-containing protein [Candidatus Marinamargulisbacteria bacterium SCGC AG-439-L15]